MRKLAQAYILAVLGIVPFIDKLGNEVRLFLLSLLPYFEKAGSFWRGSVVHACLRELCHVISLDSNETAGP